MTVMPPKLQPSEPTVPPLKEGDRLTADEFRRRYEAMPEVNKAELLRGIVYMPSPVRFEFHTRPHSLATTWLGNYATFTPGAESGPDGSMRLDDENEPQPDVMLFLPKHAGGQVAISPDDYVTGAPELVFEISGSTKKRDTGIKKDVYREFGVKEYLVWRTDDDMIDWFVLRDGNYVPLAAGPDNIHRSELFPGLWLDAKAMVECDRVRVFQVLQQGCSTPEHTAFVERLAGK